MSLKCILQGQNLAKDELDAHISNTNNPHNVTITQIGAAASIHTHTADQISGLPTSLPASDVYPWAKQPNKPSYTYSEVGAAPASHNHDASQITSGILPVSRGGTGQTTIDGIKKALGITSNLVYENTSVKNYTRALIKFPYSYRYTAGTTDPYDWPSDPQYFSVTIPFTPTRIIFKDIFPTASQWENGYSSKELNTTCGTPGTQIKIAHGNTYKNGSGVDLYMQYSGTTVSVVLIGNGYYSTPCPKPVGDYWTFAIDCILDN